MVRHEARSVSEAGTIVYPRIRIGLVLPNGRANARRNLAGVRAASAPPCQKPLHGRKEAAISQLSRKPRHLRQRMMQRVGGASQDRHDRLMRTVLVEDA
jgi:hypothetical protein